MFHKVKEARHNRWYSVLFYLCGISEKDKTRNRKHISFFLGLGVNGEMTSNTLAEILLCNETPQKLDGDDGMYNNIN